MDSQFPSRTDWLVQTKLQHPRLGDDVGIRQRLLDLIQAAVDSHRLTLRSAPAAIQAVKHNFPLSSAELRAKAFPGERGPRRD